MSDKLLTPKQTAEKLKISTRTLRRWKNRGVINPVPTPGGKVAYNPNDLKKIKKQKFNPLPPNPKSIATNKDLPKAKTIIQPPPAKAVNIPVPPLTSPQKPIVTKQSPPPISSPDISPPPPITTQPLPSSEDIQPSPIITPELPLPDQTPSGDKQKPSPTPKKKSSSKESPEKKPTKRIKKPKVNKTAWAYASIIGILIFLIGGWIILSKVFQTPTSTDSKAASNSNQQTTNDQNTQITDPSNQNDTNPTQNPSTPDDIIIGNRLRLNPQTPPSFPKAGDQYYNSTTNSMQYFDGTTWVNLDNSTSSLTLQKAYENGRIIETTKGDLSFIMAESSAGDGDFLIQLPGDNSEVIVSGGANQDLLTINDDAIYPIDISQTTRIAGTLYTNKLTDTQSSAYYLDPASTTTAAALAGGVSMAGGLTFTQNNEILTNSIDGYLSSNAGFSVGGASTYYFDTDGDINVDQITSAGILDANGQVDLGDGGDFINISGSDIILSSNRAIDFKPNNDSDDYIYLTTTSSSPALSFRGISTTNDPGIRANSSSGEIEYRDEDSSAWVSLDSLGGASSLFTDGSSIAYLTDTTQDFAVGGTTLSSPFSVDAVTGNTNISGTIDLGTNTITDGDLTGNWGFGTGNLSGIGSLTTTGTTSFNTVAYTWPGADGTGGYVLSTNGGGTLSWIAQTGGTTYWTQVSGVVHPTTTTDDLAIGGTDSSSPFFIDAATGNTIITGTSDLQGDISDSLGNLVLADTLDLGSATTGINITTTGAISDTDGNISLNDSVDIIGSLTSTVDADFEGTLTSGTADAFVVDASGNITSGTWTSTAIGVGYGGTGLTSYTIGDLIYADGASSLTTLADTAVGDVLLSGGVGVAPAWGQITLGTHTTGGYVSSITGTTNQITADVSTGDVTLSLPSDLRAPGTFNAVTGIYTGATAGTQRIDASGNLVNIGTTQLNGTTYTWPGGDGTNGYVLSTNGVGTLSWMAQSGGSGGTSYWTLGSGALYTVTDTLDLLIGGNSTASAVFQVVATTGDMIVTGTSDLQGDISDSLGNLVLADTLDLGSATTGLNITTTGLITDIDGNVIIGDTVDLGSATTGLNITTAGLITDTDGNIVLADTIDLGSATTGINVTTLGAISDSDGDISLVDSVGITGSLTATVDADFEGTLTSGTGNAFIVDASGNITSGTWTATAIGAQYGGTGQTSYAVGDLLYADGATSLAKLADVAVGSVLLSGGVTTAPAWGQVTLGTHTTGNYVSSITGTANQITANVSTGDVTLSLPSDLRSPGTVNAVTGIYTGATAGTQRLDASGNLVNIGTTQLNGTTYTWPGGDAGTAGYVLSSNAAGTLSWIAGGGTTYWLESLGALYPNNITLDLLLGGTATTSAKFAVLNMDTGTPTASISGSTTDVATYLTGEGLLATTNMAPLTIGNSTTGNIVLNPELNVGINTTNPSHDLHIYDPDATGDGAVIRLQNDQDYNFDIGFTGSTSGWGIGDNVAYVASTTADRLVFKTSATTGDLIIDSSGNVGVGTIGPDRILDVLDASNPQLRLTQADGTVYADFQVDSNGDLITGVDGTTNQLVLDNGGDIGIGVTTPTDKLTILGTAASTDGIFIQDPSASDYGARFMFDDANSTIIIGSRAGGTDIDHIALERNIANIGMGDNSPEHKLDIQGFYGGNALVSLNDIGSNDILTASASGTTRFRIDTDGYTHAQRFTDIANSTYYLDPAASGTSINIDGDIISNGAFSITSNGTNGIITLDAGSGSVYIGSSGTGKMDAGTIDPPYMINGEKYATFLSGMVGVKEETAGSVNTSEFVDGVGYRHTIDFTSQSIASDIWLFSEVTDLRENIDHLSVLLSPAGNTRAWYELDTRNYKLNIYTTTPTQVSYRLTAPRFDAETWTNERDSDSTGFILDNDGNWDTNHNGTVIGSTSSLDNVAITLDENSNFILTDLSGQLIESISTYSESVIANLRAGFINARRVVTEELVVDGQDIANLIVSTVQSAINSGDIISPLTNLDVIQYNIDQLEIQSIRNTASLSSIESSVSSLSNKSTLNDSTDASQSSRIATLESIQTSHQNQIDEIASTYYQLPAANSGSLPDPTAEGNSSDSQIDTQSLIIDDLIANYSSISALLAQSSQYVASSSGYIAIEQIDVENLNVDMLSVSQMAVVDDNLMFTNNSIQTISNDTLYIQPAGGNINLAQGLMTLSADGNTIAINGDLSVNGKLLAKDIDIENDLKVKGVITAGAITSEFGQLLDIKLATASALAIYKDIDPNPQATIDASGSATFNRLTLPHSTGVGTLFSADQNLTIPVETVTPESQVFITFSGDYSPATKYWVTTDWEENTFAIHLNYPVASPVDINWMIVN